MILYFSSLSLNETWSGTSGESFPGVTGSVVLSCRDINSWLGVLPLWIGAVLYASRPRYGLEFLLRIAFAVRTALSASPLAFGYLGEDVTWVKPQPAANCLNSEDENCGPLSEITILGTPWVENISLSALMTA